MEETMEIAAIVLSLLGTLILAFRITSILKVVTLAIQTHDLNFQVAAERASGNRSVPNVVMYGSYKHIEDVEKLGTKLLITGFVFQVAGGILHAISLLAT